MKKDIQTDQEKDKQRGQTKTQEKKRNGLRGKEVSRSTQTQRQTER